MGSDAVSSSTPSITAVFGSLATLVSRAVMARWQRDQRFLTICYFVAVFSIRLFLRTPHASNLHWVLIMAVEDMLSLTSFAIALMYMHGGHGLTLAALAKRLTMLPARPASTPQAHGTSQGAFSSRDQAAAAGPTRMQPEDVKLFFFAM